MGEHRHNPVIKFVKAHPGFTRLSDSEIRAMKKKAREEVLSEKKTKKG
jgi:hypothetical protein